MAAWSTFLVAVGILLSLLLVLSRISAALFSAAAGSADKPEAKSDTDESGAKSDTDESGAENDTNESTVFDESTDPPATTQPPPSHAEATDHPQLSTAALLANVVGTQLLFAGLLVAAAWYTSIPPAAFGVATDQLSAGAVGVGILVGGVFSACNEATLQVGRRYGMEPPTALRAALAPETPAGWIVLFVVVLPVIAGFEELLFRGALIGVVHAGFEPPLWLAAVGSSVAFGLGHSAQGRVGMLVTGLLGVGLAGVFIWTGNLLVVIVAHYVLNAVEFAVHEYR